MAIKGEIESNTVMVGNFNIPLTSMDKSSRQKINKETAALNDTLEQIKLIDIFRAFHPRATENIFFSSAHGTVSSIDGILGHKTSLNKFNKNELYKYLFKLESYEIRNQLQQKTEKFTNTCRLNNMLQNSELVNSEIKEEIKRYLRQMKKKTQHRIYGTQ